MKRVFVALVALLAYLPLHAQLSYNTVTATITDPTGNPYANAGYTISLADNQGLPVSSASTPNGQLFNAKPVTGNLDAAGRFSVRVVPNTILSKPSGTQWKFVITPPADSAILTYAEAWAITFQTTISADVDLSTQLSAVARPVNFSNLKTGQSTWSGTDSIARAAAAAALLANKPGGAPPQVQWNANGSFGGINGSAVDPTNGYITNGGVQYAKGWQTGGGNNGIANAFTNKATVVADPSYASTEQPFQYRSPANITFQSATQSHLQDLRNGYELNLAHDVAPNGYTNGSDSFIDGCINTAQVGGTTRPVCRNELYWYSSPGYNLGSVGMGPQSWSTQSGIAISGVTNTPGITEPFSVVDWKPGIGDQTNYITHWSWNGAVGGSDEGSHNFSTGGGEYPITYAGTIAVGGGGTGATTIRITCTSDCPDPGDGRFDIDLSRSIAGNATATAAPAGNFTPGTISTDISVTPSTFWGTITSISVTGNTTVLSATITSVSNIQAVSVGASVTGPGIPAGLSVISVNVGASSFIINNTATVTATGVTLVVGATGVATPLGSPLIGVNATDMAMTLASGPGNTGAPAVNDLICFGGQFHEQSKITSVIGSGPWTVHAPLRHAHEASSWVMANGMCGYFFDYTANDVVSSGVSGLSQTLRYPFDIIGSTDAHTLQYRFFFLGVGNTTVPPGKVLYAVGGTGSLTNVGGTVTIPSFTPANSGAPFSNQPLLTISGVTDTPAFNGPCTNSVYTTDFSTGIKLTCQQAASTGLTSTGAGALVSIGSTQYGNTGFVLYPGAELLDMLEYNAATCTAAGKTAPCNVGTHTLEPNNVVWTDGDSMEQPHHYASKTGSNRNYVSVFNPMAQDSPGRTLQLIGNGGLSSPAAAFGGSFSGVRAADTILSYVPVSTHVGHGGQQYPIGGYTLMGAGSGPTGGGEFRYGLAMANAPAPSNSDFLYAGCPYNGCTADPSYVYNVFSLNASGGAANLQFTPSSRSFQWLNTAWIDFFFAPIMSPKITGRANGQSATLVFNSTDSGSVVHTWTLSAPLTGGGFTETLPQGSGTLGFGLSIPTGIPTFTAGTNVTSCACAASYTCTNTRGRLTIVGGTATTGTICTITWSATLSAGPFTTLAEMGSATLHGLDHGGPSTSNVTITAASSVSGATINVDYEVQP